MGDRVEISLPMDMTVEVANGIVLDSVVEQINKAIQEGGIDLAVEEARTSGMDMSPEATSKRIVDFTAGLLSSYRNNHASRAGDVQIRGFMSLTRAAIEEGFQSSRNFLEGIAGLSQTIDENINRTFELTQQHLDEFQNAQLETASGDEIALEV
jgi:hypothetical protein